MLLWKKPRLLESRKEKYTVAGLVEGSTTTCWALGNDSVKEGSPLSASLQVLPESMLRTRIPGSEAKA